MIEHTDRQALEDLYNWPPVAAPASPPRRAWYSVVWLWLKEHIFSEPLETRTEDDAVTRRIRIHEWATQGARRLRRLDREEQREVLAVMAMLLGLKKRKR